MGPQAEFDYRDLARAHTLTVELAEFAARAGHDLLGPLNQASSLLSLFIQRHQPESDPDAKLLLDFLQTSAARMQGVISAVQPYLQIAAAAPCVESVDMSHALASAKLHLDRVIAGCDAAITADALPVIPAVPDQMVALFEILLSNCIRFRRQLEPPRIRIGCERSGANWVFHVEDNGIGIDAQYCQSVFLPFRRLQGKEYPGAGMGLATAKLIVELQGGKIRIEPAAEGAVVLFTVPASLSTPAR